MIAVAPSSKGIVKYMHNPKAHIRGALFIDGKCYVELVDAKFDTHMGGVYYCKSIYKGVFDTFGLTEEAWVIIKTIYWYRLNIQIYGNIKESLPITFHPDTNPIREGEHHILSAKGIEVVGRHNKRGTEGTGK